MPQKIDREDLLIERDMDEDVVSYGQRVIEVYDRADVFIDMRDDDCAANSVNRFIRLIFGDPFISPNKDENSMIHAHVAKVRSGSPGRQVGAVISTKDGEIVVTGTNEVPKAGGFQYWEDDIKDHREFRDGRDVNDATKKQILREVINLFKENGWFNQEQSEKEIRELLAESAGFMKKSQLMDLIEFYRPVHAEMAALLSAVHRGVSVAGCTLYVTTFPCHECTRHVIAAGIDRVVYISPYPKSRAVDLHGDSIVVDPNRFQKGMVNFEPFKGISPNRYIELFERGKRKDSKTGKPAKLDRNSATPINPSQVAYISNENHLWKAIKDKLEGF